MVVLDTMTDATPEQIRVSRRASGNPYAYVGGDGEYEATGGQAPVLDAKTDATEEQIHDSREDLENPYAHVGGDGAYEAQAAQPVPSTRASAARLEAAAVLGRKKQGDRFSKPEAGAIARRAQRALWQRSPEPRETRSPFDIVDPSAALKSYGVDVFEELSLGEFEQDGRMVDVAAILDRDNSLVRFSSQFTPQVRRFTLAHELAHVLLHQGSGLHRDRALDGSASNRSSSPEEREADWFAAAFVMPGKLLCREFERRFSTRHFTLDENTAFGLGDVGSASSRERGRLSLRLARATHFHGVPFIALADRFQVSITAMAIRLEELGLVDP